MQRALWPDGRVEADRHAGEEGGNGKKEGHQFPSCSEGRPPREPMGDSCEQGQQAETGNECAGMNEDEKARPQQGRPSARQESVTRDRVVTKKRGNGGKEGRQQDDNSIRALVGIEVHRVLPEQLPAAEINRLRAPTLE